MNKGKAPTGTFPKYMEDEEKKQAAEDYKAINLKHYQYLTRFILLTNRGIYIMIDG